MSLTLPYVPARLVIEVSEYRPGSRRHARDGFHFMASAVVD
jgi:hypothetical protein